MIKKFKPNYNKIAGILAILVVLIFTVIEFLSPDFLQKDITATKPLAEENQSVALPVIMYHHILETANRLGDYVISPYQLEEDLKLIKEKGYTSVLSTDIIKFVEENVPLPDKPIYITFDDGYESVYKYAFPLLKKYNMKACVSIIGKYTDLFSNPNEPKHINYSHLNWSELKEMQESGLVEIENHSYDMHGSSSAPRYGIRKKSTETSAQYRTSLHEDLGLLNNEIKNNLNSTATVFAYPFGALCKESRVVLNELGFKIILTCEEKVNYICYNKYNDRENKLIVLKRFNRATKYSTHDFFKKMGIT